jgi:hypothetical protein
MATTESTLESQNFLQPTGFKVVVLRKRFKNLEFFAQSVQHPDLSVAPSVAQFRGTNALIPGDKLEYGTLTIDAIMDENMNVYKEMHEWLKSTVEQKYKPANVAKVGDEDITTYDISLMVLSSHNNTIDTIRYKSTFPISIGTVNFQSTADAVQYVTFPITFAYTTFTITN